MSLTLSIMGMLLFVFLKTIVYKTDDLVDRMRTLVGVPVEICLIGFLLSMVSVPVAAEDGKYVPHSILVSVFLCVLSIFLWKYSCQYIKSSGVGGGITDNIKVWGIFILNVLICALAIFNPIYFLEAAVS